MTQQLPVIVAGGGIGGLAAALALVRQGFSSRVLEQATDIGEIGAAIQLCPNVIHAFDALGVGDKARSRSVFTDEMVMHEALDETLVGRVPSGEAFRQRFGNPCAAIHRVELHRPLREGAQETGGVTLLGDAARPTTHYTAQGACTTLEDATGWLYGWSVTNYLAAA